MMKKPKVKFYLKLAKFHWGRELLRQIDAFKFNLKAFFIKPKHYYIFSFHGQSRKNMYGFQMVTLHNVVPFQKLDVIDASVIMKNQLNMDIVPIYFKEISEYMFLKMEHSRKNKNKENDKKDNVRPIKK